MKRLNNLLGFILLAVFVVACKKKDDLRAIPFDSKVSVEYDPAVFKSGATVYGHKNYTQIIVGDVGCPVLLASPHDGTIDTSKLDPKIKDRSTSNGEENVRDQNVTILVKRIADSLKKITGLRPHIIINNLPRVKMEPNRSLADAYLTHPDAVQAWNDYQRFIKIARDLVKKNVGRGLFLDMHGHGHPKQRTEVGYLLTANELNRENSSIDYMAEQTSIYSIGKYSSMPFSSLINGDYAFGTLMANHGIPAVPSKQDPRPLGDKYFNGGYCTSSYGSRNSGDDISAIQLETQGNIRFEEPQSIVPSGQLARAIIDYFKLNYNMDLLKK